MYNPEVRALLSKDVFRPSKGSESAAGAGPAAATSSKVLFSVQYSVHNSSYV